MACSLISFSQPFRLRPLGCTFRSTLKRELLTLRLFSALTTPEFNFVLEIDSVFALDPLANFFREGERVVSARVVALGHDEVCVFRRNHCPASPRSLHAEIVDHLARTERARRWIFEEATGGARAVWLRRHSLALGFFHPRADFLGVTRVQNQSRAQE